MLAAICAAERAADRAHDRVHAGGDAGLRLRHGLDDQVRHRGEREADADAEQRAADVDLPALACARPPAARSSTRRCTSRSAAAPASRSARRARPPPGRRRASRPSTGAGTAPPRSPSRRSRSRSTLGQLHELRDEDERAEHPEADAAAPVRLVVQTARPRIIRMSTSGSGDAQLEAHPDSDQDGRRARTGRGSRGEPQPQRLPSLTPSSSEPSAAGEQRGAAQSILRRAS